MPVLMLFAMVAIFVGVVVVATGRGGELAFEQVDHAPIDMGRVSATDVAMLRPPTALWGYNMQVTDEALDRIARALRDRDIEIAYLQRQLADLGYTDYERPRDFVPKHERLAEAEDAVAGAAGLPVAAQTSELPAVHAGEQPAEEPENTAAEEQGW